MICLIFFAGIVGTLAALGWANPKSKAKASKLRQHITMDHVMNGTFSVQRKGESRARRGKKEGRKQGGELEADLCASIFGVLGVSWVKEGESDVECWS